MPTLTRWFIKSSLAYFVAALVLAVLLALQAPLNLPSANALQPQVGFGWLLALCDFVVAWWDGIRAQHVGTSAVAFAIHT